MAKLVSKVYAQALFDLVKDLNKLDFVYEEVKVFSQILIENNELEEFLNSPKISKEEKIESIEKIFSDKISKELMGLVLSVISKGRQTKIQAIFQEFISLVKAYKNIGIAYVTSAIELEEDKKEKIKAKLLETSDYKEIEIYYDVDTAIIGGLVIRIDDRVIDSSVSKRLYNIKRELLNIKLA